MNVRTRPTRPIVPLAKSWLVATVLLTACGGASPAAGPAALLISPGRDTVINVGQPAAIAGTVNGPTIKTVDIFIDDRKYATVANKNDALNQFIINVQWTPTLAGSHLIQLRGIDEKGSPVVQSEAVVVTVKPGAIAPTAVIAVTTVVTVVAPTPAAAQTAAAPGATAAPAATATPAPTKAPANQITVTNDFVRVRNGPSTASKELGQLAQGATAAVQAKSEDGKWWQIIYAQSDGGVGWVFGDLVQFKGDANAVPVAKAAASPTTAPTTVPATATPKP